MSAMLPSRPDLQWHLDELDRSKDTQHEWHKYRTNVPQIGKPDGYTNRSLQVAALESVRGIALEEEDPKEFYHYSPGTLGTMKQLHSAYGWGKIPTEVTRLHESFQPLHAKSTNLIFKICGLIEETHPEIRNLVTPQSLRTSPVRMLFYHPSDKTEQLAGKHKDKGVMTLQIAESHKGLRVARDDDGPLVPVVRNHSKAVFFPSLRLSEVAPESMFIGKWHDVTISKELNEGRTIPTSALEICARYAIIFFVNGSEFTQPDKQMLHG